MSELDKEELKATRELNKDKYKNCEIYEIERVRNKIENNKISKRLEKVLGIEKEDKDILIAFKESLFEKTVKENIKLKKENEKKDKMIDKFISSIAENYCYIQDICDDKCIGNNSWNCYKCIKQYFERKVEE